MALINITEAEDITILEQELEGTSVTLVLSKKQFTAIVWFLCNPNSSRLRVTDAVTDTAVVYYSSEHDEFSISQSDQEIYGSRAIENCGFSETLWMHRLKNVQDSNGPQNAPNVNAS